MYRYAQRGIRGLIYGPKNMTLRATRGESLKPQWLWFGVTDKCNSRCRHCSIWNQKPTAKPLSTHEIEKTFSDPLFKEVRYVINSGGEPVVRNDIKEIILIEHKTLPKARLQLSTNGLLPERAIDVVEMAMENDIKLDVGVSLDGVGEKHDEARGVKGNFKKVDWLLRTLANIRERYGGDNLVIQIGFTLSNLTLSSLDEVRIYAQRLNMNLLVQWYNMSSFYSNTETKYAISNEDLVKAIESLDFNPIYAMWLESIKGKPFTFPCFAMHTFCVLQCDGTIAPCLSLWHVKVGNVRDNSPSTIWRSAKADEVRKMVKNCQGCLNSWGTGWSFESCLYPILISHPSMLIRTLRKL